MLRRSIYVVSFSWLAALTTSDAFCPTLTSLRRQASSPSLSSIVALEAKKKKKNKKPQGFATTVEEKDAVDTSKPAAAAGTTPTAVTPSAGKPQVASSTTPPMNEGQKALARMRRDRAEQKDAELRKVREMVQADEQLQETPAVIPEKVAQRMTTRMISFVGVPLFLGLGSFVAFWYLATYKNMEFQPAVVAATTIGILAVSLVGITYSVMSTSWDVEREGDFLGTDEFQKNLGNIQEGLGRSRENAMLREKMAGLADGELENALQDLERREQREVQQKQTLQSKLQDELE